MIGDHFLDAEVLWPKALSKCSAQRVKATKHPWENHNSGQRAGTAVLRDGTANIGQWHHWKLSEEKPGLCHLWDFHLCIPSPQLFRQNKEDEHFPTSDRLKRSRAFFHTRSSPQASELLGGRASLFCWERRRPFMAGTQKTNTRQETDPTGNTNCVREMVRVAVPGHRLRYCLHSHSNINVKYRFISKLTLFYLKNGRGKKCF